MSDVKRRERILKENLLKVIIIICFPLAIYQLFNSFYTLVDQIVCASISTDAQNAVSAISQIKSTISAFGGGLAAGGGVIVARHYGAGDVNKARGAASNLLFMAIVLSVVIMLILIPLSKPILIICQLTDAQIEMGVGYFRLQLVELIFVTINSVFIGLEKAKGNSKLVLILNFIVMVIKLGLDFLFVWGMDLRNIIYVELATIIAQGALTIVGLYLLFRPSNIIRLSLKKLRPRKEFILPILKLSIPIFLGKFVMSLGKVVVNAMCGAYWNAATDGMIVGTLGVSNNICGLITSPTNSFEEGESSVVSQNLGNRNITRATRAFKYTFILAAIVSITGYVLMRFVFIDNLVDLFSNANVEKMLAGLTEEERFATLSRIATYKGYIKDIFRFDSLSIISLGLTAAVLGLLYGFGQTRLSTVLNLSRIGSRIIILLIFHQIPDLAENATLCAGLSMGISNGVILLLALLFLLIFYIRLKKNGYNGMHLGDPEPEVKALIFNDENNVEEKIEEEKIIDVTVNDNIE